MHKLSFVSLNVRGLNASRKRRAIFRQLHNRRASVIFLQETYSSPDQEKIWSNEWGSKIYFSHGSKHSKGVAILFNPKLHVSAGIMYGYNPGSSGSYIFNYYILLSKRHVFLQKYEHKLPNLLLFLELVKGKMLIQRTIAHAKGQKENFLNLWKPLLTII